jgi:hypothetical protein
MKLMLALSKEVKIHLFLRHNVLSIKCKQLTETLITKSMIHIFCIQAVFFNVQEVNW